MLHHIYFFNSATMQFFLSLMLVISFATFQLAFGDEKKVDSLTDDSKQDHEVADFERTESDDELDDGAEYRWLAPVMFDELRKRGNITQSSAGGSEEEGEELKKNKKKAGGNKNKVKNKDKNKNLPAKKKFKEKGMPPK